MARNARRGGVVVMPQRFFDARRLAEGKHDGAELRAVCMVLRSLLEREAELLILLQKSEQHCEGHVQATDSTVQVSRETAHTSIGNDLKGQAMLCRRLRQALGRAVYLARRMHRRELAEDSELSKLGLGGLGLELLLLLPQMGNNNNNLSAPTAATDSCICSCRCHDREQSAGVDTTAQNCAAFANATAEIKAELLCAAYMAPRQTEVCVVASARCLHIC